MILGFFEELLNNSDHEESNSINDTPIKWMDQIVARKEIDLLGSSPFDLKAILMDIMLYDRISLSNKAFFVLYSLFSQRLQLCDLLEQTQLLEDQSMISNYDVLRQIKRKFTKLADEFENWFSFDSPESRKTCFEALEIIDKVCGLITNLDQKKRKNQNEDMEIQTNRKKDYEVHEFIKEIENVIEGAEEEIIDQETAIKREEINFIPPGKIAE
jgi:hypothetical protein